MLEGNKDKLHRPFDKTCCRLLLLQFQGRLATKLSRVGVKYQSNSYTQELKFTVQVMYSRSSCVKKFTSSHRRPVNATLYQLFPLYTS